jgi:hypothetical protein
MKEMEDELTGRKHLTFVIQRLLLTNVFSEKRLTIAKIYIQKKNVLYSIIHQLMKY